MLYILLKSASYKSAIRVVNDVIGSMRGSFFVVFFNSHAEIIPNVLGHLSLLLSKLDRKM